MLPSTMAADPDRLEPPIQAVLDATNGGNADGFLAAFAKDATLSDWGEAHTGRKEIGRWDREKNTGAKVNLEVTGVSRIAGEILVLLKTSRGKEPAETGTWAFRVAGGKIVSLEIG